MENLLNVALAQIAPVWLDKKATIAKIEKTIIEAASNGSELIVFGEALLPGYPFWLAHTEGAAWNLEVNKELHAHYVRNAIQIEAGELDSICQLAKEKTGSGRPAVPTESPRKSKKRNRPGTNEPEPERRWQKTTGYGWRYGPG